MRRAALLLLILLGDASGDVSRAGPWTWYRGSGLNGVDLQSVQWRGGARCGWDLEQMVTHLMTVSDLETHRGACWPTLLDADFACACGHGFRGRAEFWPSLDEPDYARGRERLRETFETLVTRARPLYGESLLNLLRRATRGTDVDFEAGFTCDVRLRRDVFRRYADYVPALRNGR